jgi:hypothetical protein
MRNAAITSVDDLGLSIIVFPGYPNPIIEPEFPQEPIGNTREQCGPDVTDAIYRMLAEARSRWGKDPSKQCDGCKRCLWSISEAISGNCFDLDWINMYPGLPTGGLCSGTVTVNGQCHYAADVTYFLFGLMSQLCGITQEGTGYRYQAYQCCVKPLHNIIRDDHQAGVFGGTPDSVFEDNPTKWQWILFGRRGGLGSERTPRGHPGLTRCDASGVKADPGIAKWPW